MSSQKSNAVTPGKKPISKVKKGNSKTKVVASKNVKSPIVKEVVSKKEVVPKKIMKTTGPTAPSKPVSIVASNTTSKTGTTVKPVVKTVSSTKQTVKKPVVKANANTNVKTSTVAKNVNKTNANAVKTENKAVKASQALKSTTKGVKSAATLSASTKTGTTATNISKTAKNTTKGVAKAATTVNKKKQTPKKVIKPVVVQSEEDLNKQIDKYISNAGIPSVSTIDLPKEKTELIEDVVESDYSRTQEYKDLAAELREQAQKEAREEYEKELDLSRTTIARIEDAVEKEINEPKEEVVDIEAPRHGKDHIETGETIELSSLGNKLEETSAYQDIDEALKHQIKNEIEKDDKAKKGFTFYKLIKWIFALVSIGISGLFGYTAIASNYLPLKYNIILGLVLFVINLINVLFLSRKHKIFNIFGMLLVIAFSSIFLVGYNYMNSTFDVIKDILTQKESTTEYYYVVLSTSSYASPADLENKTVGLVEANSENVMNKVSEDTIMSFTKYETSGMMLYSLDLHEIEGAIMTADSYDVMAELDENFKNNVRIIGTFDVVGQPEQIDSTIEANQSFVLYLSGVDTRDTSSVPEYGLSDVNMLVVVNPTAHRVLLVNIPRDYYVQLHGTEGKLRDKLTHAGLYGASMSMNTLSDLFNVRVNAYVRVNFATVTTLVDDIDGIDVFSDKSFDSYHMPGWRVPYGTVHMNGKQALAFSRERYAYQSGDRHRGENQQAVMTAIINKISTNKKYLLQYDKILGDISPYFATNIKEEDIQALVKEQLNSMPSWTVESISVNGSNSSNYTYSWPTQSSYVMIPDQSTIDAAKAKMSEVMKA